MLLPRSALGCAVSPGFRARSPTVPNAKSTANKLNVGTVEIELPRITGLSSQIWLWYGWVHTPCRLRRSFAFLNYHIYCRLSIWTTPVGDADRYLATTKPCSWGSPNTAFSPRIYGRYPQVTVASLPNQSLWCILEYAHGKP